jgi:transcriptional regulator with XRE-family HTH domain
VSAQSPPLPNRARGFATTVAIGRRQERWASSRTAYARLDLAKCVGGDPTGYQLMSTGNPYLADNLHRLMGMHRVGQKDVAERLGTTKQSVWEWASGRKVPRWATLADLAALFGIELPDLLADPERAVQAAARAFARAPIRSTTQLPRVRPTPDAVDEMRAEILTIPPKGLSTHEIAEFRRAQRRPKSGQPDDRPRGTTGKDS